MPYSHVIELGCQCRAFELSLMHRSEKKWKLEIEAEKRAARAAKLDAGRAAKCTIEAQQQQQKLKGQLVEINHQLELERCHGKGLIERAERAEAALQAEKVSSGRGRIVLYV